MKIYVENLDYKVNKNDLTNVFEEYGTVVSSQVITDKYSGRSRGFGFVEMENDDEANKAIEELNGTTFMNREINVNIAKLMKEKPSRD